LDKNSIEDLNNLKFSLQKNTVFVQQGNTGNMLWKIDEIIAYISKYFTLKIGDIIFTGTPEGVGKVEINDRLTGFIEDEQIFSIQVK
jgi:2-keto-4-pentenoate hydratase/2-oxohepta-3-ene-1,7-dioic acid hydratase in catechol pathway